MVTNRKILKHTFAAFLLFAAPFIHGEGEQMAIENRLTPRILFVGDRGTLVTTLGQEFAEAAPFVRKEGLPQTRDIHLNRVELDRRNGSIRLIIDFVSYRPGVVPLPSLVIPSLRGNPLTVSNLSVSIASALKPHSLMLSEIAPPLVPAGTFFLLYGVIAGILAVAFLGICMSPWGRPLVAWFWEKLFRRLLVLRIAMTLNRVSLNLRRNKDGTVDGREMLAGLSRDFRELLTLRTKVNCSVLTAGEFSALSDGFADVSAVFSGWDMLRFNDKNIENEDLLRCVEEARRVLKNTK
ncbi:MAG: hypothetical protein MdMp014T_0106 [Treponematales bacterium]